MDRWMNGWMDRWMDGQMDRCVGVGHAICDLHQTVVILSILTLILIKCGDQLHWLKIKQRITYKIMSLSLHFKLANLTTFVTYSQSSHLGQPARYSCYSFTSTNIQA